MEIISTLIIRIITIFCLAPALLFGQAPSNYYQGIQDLEGEALKEALHNIIKDHIVFPYTSSNIDLWDILKETDKDTINPQNIILFYTGWSVDAEQEYNSGNGWTREHVWAKSHGSFGNDLGVGTDAHNIRPCDGSVNSARSNLDFDNGGEIYEDPDGLTTNRKDEDSWEPRDEVKGDVARILFYMSVRYEGYENNPDLELTDGVGTFDLNEPGRGFHGNLKALLEWHREDPVDSFEKRRNEVIFSYQGNRNPFIDHPEFVDRIWKSELTHTNELVSKPLIVYPNPVKDYLHINIKNPTSIMIYSNEGRIRVSFSIRDQVVNLSGLEAGHYIIKVKDDYTHWVGRFVKI